MSTRTEIAINADLVRMARTYVTAFRDQLAESSSLAAEGQPEDVQDRILANATGQIVVMKTLQAVLSRLETNSRIGVPVDFDSLMEMWKQEYWQEVDAVIQIGKTLQATA